MEEGEGTNGSLKDQVAAMAMAAIIQKSSGYPPASPYGIARLAFEYAEAFMRVRDNPPKPEEATPSCQWGEQIQNVKTQPGSFFKKGG